MDEKNYFMPHKPAVHSFKLTVFTPYEGATFSAF
jgi:hypothetical protein